MNRKKKIYIHIGMPKTGSSAIQAFFAINEAILSKYDYIFPWHPGFGQSHQTSAGNATKLHHWIIEGKIDEFEREINQLKQNNIVLSSEVLFHTARLKPEMFSIFVKRFDFKVICYIRKIDDLIESCVNQLVKNHGFTSYENLKNIVDDHDYARTLIELSKYLDKEKIDVRIYDRNIFPNGSIYEDVLDAIDFLELSRGSALIEPEKVINPSLSPEAFELRRLLNVIGFDEDNSQDKYRFNGVLAQYSVENKKEIFSILSMNERQDIFNYFKLNEIKLNKIFFDEDERIFSSISNVMSPVVEDKDVGKVLLYIAEVDVEFFKLIVEKVMALSGSQECFRLSNILSRFVISKTKYSLFNRYSTVLFKPLLVVMSYNFAYLTHGYSSDIQSKSESKPSVLVSSGNDPYFSIAHIDCNGLRKILVKVIMESTVECKGQLHYQTNNEPYFGNRKFLFDSVKKGLNELSFFIDRSDLNGLFRFDPLEKTGEVNIHSMVFFADSRS